MATADQIQASLTNPKNDTPQLILNYLADFKLENNTSQKTTIDSIDSDGMKVPRFTNEFWTSKQRQGNSLHEVSYRACFKPQLPKFFIELLTKEKDFVYDPFSGRGTTAIEAALLNRNVIANDINPLSEILCKPRLEIPTLEEISLRLNEISYTKKLSADIDLSMFYHPDTFAEIICLKKSLERKRNDGEEDFIDRWIRMVTTNRLTGHSKNFFSVYTLPPNQAISAEKQKQINVSRNQVPSYKNTKEIILLKSKTLLKNIGDEVKNQLRDISSSSKFITGDARTTGIEDEKIQLTVTSPPFLDIVQYGADNWLRCWFNGIDVSEIEKKITMSKKLEDWLDVMKQVFFELHRITKQNGWVAFEVGEVRKGKIKLDEAIIPIGIEAGFDCVAVIINEQKFTKTANIWGIDNNSRGTNSNRIVLFQKKNSN